MVTALNVIAVMPVNVTEPERWIAITEVGFEVLGQTNSVKLSGVEAMKIFADSTSHLSENWREALKGSGRTIPPPAPLPNYVYPTKENASFARVAGFSSTSVNVMILRERGYYLWQHFYECLANLSIKRSAEVDGLFGLEDLEKTYGAIFKGLRQGDSIEKVKEVLGEPDAIETYQAAVFLKYSYFKDDVVITFYPRITKIEHGVPPEVKKEVESTGKKQINH